MIGPANTMARRSDHSRQELYEMVMDTARAIVEQDGLRNLTARNIAAAIGYSPGTLYNLFENLDELIIHLNATTLDALYDAISSVKRTGEPEKDLKAMLRIYLAFLEENTALWTAIFEFRSPGEDHLPDWYREKVGKLMTSVEEAIAPLFADSESAARQQAAGILWSSLHGVCTLAKDGRLCLISDQSNSQMAESLIVNFLAGLRSRIGMGQQNG